MGKEENVVVNRMYSLIPRHLPVVHLFVSTVSSEDEKQTASQFLTLAFFSKYSRYKYGADGQELTSKRLTPTRVICRVHVLHTSPYSEY